MLFFISVQLNSRYTVYIIIKIMIIIIIIVIIIIMIIIIIIANNSNNCWLSKGCSVFKWKADYYTNRNLSLHGHLPSFAGSPVACHHTAHEVHRRTQPLKLQDKQRGIHRLFRQKKKFASRKPSKQYYICFSYYLITTERISISEEQLWERADCFLTTCASFDWPLFPIFGNPKALARSANKKNGRK